METDVEIRLPSALSPSSLDSYRTCPRKFYYEKIERRSTTSNVKAELGTFGHSVVEALLNLAPQERTLPKTREIAAGLWDELMVGDRQPVLRDMIDVELPTKDMKAHVWKSVSGFFSMVKPKGLTVVETERHLEGFVGTVPMRGYVDFILLEGQALSINDLKTGKAPWGKSVPSKLTQVGVYCALVEAKEDRDVATGVLLYVHPRKRFELSWTTQAKADILTEVESVWYGILEDFENGWFEPAPNFLCTNEDPKKVWCDFKAICPHWN